MELLRVWRGPLFSACCKGILAPTSRIPACMTFPQALQSRSTMSSIPNRSVAVISTSLAPQMNTNRVPNLRLQTVRKYSDENKMTALVAFKDLKHLKSSPLPALVMGLSGLVPFVLVPGSMIISSTFSPMLAYAHVAYGATILSFLGGIRWGFSIAKDSPTRPDWRNLGYSVAPALMAWTGLLLPSTEVSILALTAGLAWAVYVDASMWGYPPWFKALRFVLSFVAILSLWTTLVCKYILSDRKKKLKDSKEKESVDDATEMTIANAHVDTEEPVAELPPKQ